MDGWMFGLLVGWIDGWMDRRMARLENKHQENRVFTGFSEKQCREDYQRNHCLFYRQTRSSTCENKILGYLSVGSICYSRRNSDTKALHLTYPLTPSFVNLHLTF